MIIILYLTGCGGNSSGSQINGSSQQPSLPSSPAEFESKAEFTSNVTEVLDTDFYSSKFIHASTHRLAEVSNAIYFLAGEDNISDADLMRLMEYLSVYALFGPKEDLDSIEFDLFNRALLALAQMSDYHSQQAKAARLIKHYMRALRDYNESFTVDRLSVHLDQLLTTLRFFETLDEPYSEENFVWAVYESLNALDSLLSDARADFRKSVYWREQAGLLTELSRIGKNSVLMMPPEGDRSNILMLDKLLDTLAQIWLLQEADSDQSLREEIDIQTKSVIDTYKSRGNFYEALKRSVFESYISHTRYSGRLELCSGYFREHCMPDRSSDDGSIFTQNVLQVLSPGMSMEVTFNHLASKRLLEVANAIAYLAAEDDLKDPALEALLNYSKRYGKHLGRDVSLSAEEVMALDTALNLVFAMSGLQTAQEPTGRILSVWAVIIRVFYSRTEMTALLSQKLDQLRVLADYLLATESFRDQPDFDSAVIEILRTIAWLAYDAYLDEALADIIISHGLLLDGLQALAGNKQIIFKSKRETFVINLWLRAMSELWYIGEAAGDTNYQQDVDTVVKTVINEHRDVEQFDLLKAVVLAGYLGEYGTNRLALCSSEFAGLCGPHSAALEQAFEDKFGLELTAPSDEVLVDPDGIFVDSYRCPHLNIKVRAQQITTEQASAACHALQKVKANFHRLTGVAPNEPVPNDGNAYLEFFIFTMPAQNVILRESLFSVKTRITASANYYEEDLSDPNTHPYVIANSGESVNAEYLIDALQHEYAHYLDGRFIKYRYAENFVDYLVWWEEGLAEYIESISSQDEPEPKIVLLERTAEQGWPGIEQILNARISEKALAYSWSFWLHRFMFERHRYEMINLISYLRRGREEDGRLFKSTVEAWPNNYQGEFRQYLRDIRDGHSQEGKR